MAENIITSKAEVSVKTRRMYPHEILISTDIQNAAAMQAWGKQAGDADLGDLLKLLREEVKKVAQDGDMKPAEAMLYGQALALQTIFTSLACRAATDDRLKHFQVNMSLALKAQAQCRATLEALALVKNPMPYIRQANIAHGPQQVNNAGSGAGNFRNEPNELLTKGGNMARHWTAEERALQSELISRWAPWDSSTGPKTEEGKAAVAGNAWRGGERKQLRELSKMVNDEISLAREFVESIYG